jgi:hypothetical protein
VGHRDRVASAIVRIVVLPLLANVGVLAMFAAIAAALVASIMLLLAFGPRGRTRQPVE